MAVFPQIERLFWFHDQVKCGRFPNAGRLAEQFEITRKTAQRDITRLRDRLRAPMAYDACRKGYYYTDDHFELPYLPASQQEILCLLLARKVLSQSAQGYISRDWRKFYLARMTDLQTLEQEFEPRPESQWRPGRPGHPALLSLPRPLD
jgi:predicted DNA-binding transcriptional regulator YafY